MVSVREIEQASMTKEKRKAAKNNLFAFYVGRPISYWLTIPFLQAGVSPNTVSLLSLVPVVAGIVISVFARNLSSMYVCWGCFFIWNLLDGVDGNIARYTKKTSPLGAIYDAMGGYAATAATFLAWGIAAERFPGLLDSKFISDYNLFLIIGSLSSLSTLFPRLIMQKVRAEIGKDKAEVYKGSSLLRNIVFNLTSVSGFIQVIMLLTIPFRLFDLFTIAYFVINIGLMVLTIYQSLKK